MRNALIGTVLAILGVTACAGGGASSPSAASASASSTANATASPPPTPGAVDLTVFAAASLARALERVELMYETSDAGATLTISTDSSAALETQIEQGAPADVFLSADTTNPEKLVDGGFADGDAVVFAGNELTIITPVDDPAGLRTPFDLATAGVRIIAAGDEVPITTYATKLVDNLAKDAGAPADFAAAYAANVVSKEDDVAAVRAKIEIGEGDAAIVYVTDATASDRVSAIDVPDSANVPASYAGVVVKASSHIEAAHHFLEWLAGPDRGAVLAEFGFLPPAS